MEKFYKIRMQNIDKIYGTFLYYFFNTLLKLSRVVLSICDLPLNSEK